MTRRWGRNASSRYEPVQSLSGAARPWPIPGLQVQGVQQCEHQRSSWGRMVHVPGELRNAWCQRGGLKSRSQGAGQAAMRGCQP